MREENLYDTERNPLQLNPRQTVPRDQREPDGSFNALGCPWMGMAGARFGRTPVHPEATPRNCWRAARPGSWYMSRRKLASSEEARRVAQGAVVEGAPTSIAGSLSARVPNRSNEIARIAR